MSQQHNSAEEEEEDYGPLLISHLEVCSSYFVSSCKTKLKKVVLLFFFFFPSLVF